MSAPLPTGTRRRSRPAAERSVISDSDRRRPAVRIPLTVVQVLILIGLIVAGLGPLLWLLKAALSPTQDILRDPLAFFPSGVVEWGNLATAWNQGHLGFYLGNTAILALGSMIANLFVCATGAYVLSVLRPKWGPVLSGAILATLFIPGIVSLVPLYLTVLKLPLVGADLTNTYWAVWLPAAANGFNVLVIKRFFDSIPREYFEAARIDGAGHVRVFTTIVLPLSRPILGVVALLAVIASWKDYLWPLLVLPNPDLQPVSVALPKIAQFSPLNIQLAGLFLALLIPVVLFIVFQRSFLRGVGMSGGVKG
ncbi:carbohydrate ABC transporter membrane protein 2, CUT1 family [Leifsonia sp. 98AMF]|uniref:carbohydrate ABC transporter permease n=1 Tax=unclassified Leifsonia TaxID=2663824 RepID=UPI00087AE17C|nr:MULTISPECIES: carbohydrate ABC transporter permease [unclassified Leifsonia]SDH07049.1 carbohydrate ABC transporter membrane protein 2, CUT1 family [Leifsonia sp. 197AMF]SDJ33184.1 carbohydrate ABC transporter membrane protein 2, CUT1 family [Leifsonia sp. 466MF]SDK46759.1 carbohydrate ABC transporter membrane protein 2, CUT1 family [Leifsonia sp. 157MF]SDN54163.1 carbohydrate ABC transporter membrane protein 2, CUT1 family [Leifsonia sp. 509MF]SEN55900.1 carbohydrate ABC transporter membra